MNILQSVLNNNYSSKQQLKDCKNCFNSRDLIELRADEITRISPGSQILLGNNFIIDTRNPHLQTLLNSKDEVIIGKNPSCNIIASDFYNGVSDKHIKLTKTLEGIFVNDLSSEKGSKIIPKNEIKPFITGINNLKLSQGNIGDCFLLSTIYALSQTKKGAEMLDNMVKIEENGDFSVKFCNQVPIRVKAGELDGEIYQNGTVKHCVEGDLSIRAIERAYAKLIKNNKSNADFLTLNKGGYPDAALKILTGLDTKIYHTPKQKSDILLKIEKEGIENFVITCSTPTKGKYGEFADDKCKFISNHAYSIKSINSEKNSIEIINPHNTKKSETVSFEEFQNIFDCIFAADI